MSDSGTQELEDFLTQELEATVRSGSPGEAPREDTETVVHDQPPAAVEAPPPLPNEQESLPEQPELEPDEQEPDELEEEGDQNLSWAKRKYGDDPAKWARAAYEQEQHISRLVEGKRQADELASQWYQYAQQVEAQQQTQMPLSAQEEQWAEQSLSNPLQYARQAAFAGNVNLYNAVINRVAEENVMLATQIGTQVQMDLAAAAAQAEPQQTRQPLEQALGASFQRLGIDLRRDGPRMSEILNELGEYHSYTQAIMNGTERERDLAVQAIHDMTRRSTFSTRQVERAKNIREEEELRRQASVVQTGGIAPPPPPAAPSPLQQGMIEEWKRAGAWPEDD